METGLIVTIINLYSFSCSSGQRLTSADFIWIPATSPMTSTSNDSRAPCPPSTSDFLEFHAIQSPNKVAIDWNHQTHTYAQMHQDLVRVKQALHQLGLRPGQFALIHQRNPYIHVLLLLACENLRVVAASQTDSKNIGLYEKADVLLSHSPELNAAIAVFVVDDQWLASLVATPIDPDLHKLLTLSDPQDPVLVTRSSGTTGIPKLIRLHRSQLEYSIQSMGLKWGFSRSSVCIVLYGFEVASIWRQISACLRAGGTVVWGELSAFGQKYRLTHMWILPVDLGNLIEKFSGTWKKKPGLVIYTAGAQLPEQLRTTACQCFCDDIINTYGSNEVGAICKLDHHNMGILQPGVELMIVNDDGQALAVGEEGSVAVKSPSMIHQYWEQADYTALHFRNGWFYPGDRAKLIQPRLLQYLGRNDELLNFGGIKQPPEFIEKIFLSLPKVLEAAATSIQRSDGVDVLLVAVVLRDPSDLAEVQHAARSKLSSFAPQMRVISCQSLPRTPNGKIKRLAVRELASTSP